MNTNEIVQQLRAEMDKLDAAIKALEGLSGSSAAGVSSGGKRRGRPPKNANQTTTSTPKKRRKMSAAARKRIGDAARARWAAAKKSGKKRL